ncbi:MAG TPA: YceI family protein [Solirubrobacteraceae bacterium]|jgi:polyisoprenoid-binding protein YceI|nr:YceI family protein [Solirubrobacteraceae bacterium]
MSAPTAATQTKLPTGTWKLDPTHSSASFAVKHMVVATFRGRFDQFDATLAVAEDGGAQLIGAVDARSIAVKDENLQAHLGAPDFFDTERYPELSFVSNEIRRDGDELVVDGELTIKGNTHPVEARGTITDPHETLGGAIKVGVMLETVIDRTRYGLEWNAPLPKGGFALADEVKLTIELELAKVDGE